MCITYSQPISIRDHLETSVAWSHQKPEYNGQWTKALYSESWDQCTSEDKAAVWTIRPDTQVGLDGPPIDSLLHQLFPNLTNRNRRATKQALQCAMLTAYQCVSQPTLNRITGFLHGIKTARSKQLDRYKNTSVSDFVLGNVLKSLVEAGFLEVHKGFKGKGYSKGLTTLWIPTDQLIRWFRQNAGTVNPSMFTNEVELVVLRDQEKALMDYKDSTNTLAMRRNLEASNALRTAHTWTYHALEDDYQFQEGMTRTTIHPIDLMCKRIFKDSFKTGGRFYCGAQQLKKAERETICIDAEPTVELDFKSMQPHMIYHRKGLGAPIDAYKSDLMDRKTAKLVCLICLNAKDKSSAKRAVISELRITKLLATKYIESFVEQHSLILDWFFSSAWGTLQYLESQIADKSLIQALEKDIPVLPIHDSYITRTRDVFEMRDILLEAYKDLLGFEAVLDWNQTEIE